MEKTGAGGPGQRSAGEGRRLIENGLNDLQRAVMVVVVSRVIGDSFDAFGGIAHGECVFHQLQHFRIVAAVADGDALLRRELPAFEQAADAVRFVQPGNN